MTAKLKIIARAVTIRLNNGESLLDILDSYPALTSDERNEITEYVSQD